MSAGTNIETVRPGLRNQRGIFDPCLRVTFPRPIPPFKVRCSMLNVRCSSPPLNFESHENGSMLPAVSRGFIGLTAILHRLKTQSQQECQPGSKSDHQRPALFSSGHLPKPPPVEEKVDKNQGQKRIGKACVDIAPVVPRHPQSREPLAAA